MHISHLQRPPAVRGGAAPSYLVQFSMGDLKATLVCSAGWISAAGIDWLEEDWRGGELTGCGGNPKLQQAVKTVLDTAMTAWSSMEWGDPIAPCARSMWWELLCNLAKAPRAVSPPLFHCSCIVALSKPKQLHLPPRPLLTCCECVGRKGKSEIAKCRSVFLAGARKDFE